MVIMLIGVFMVGLCLVAFTSVCRTSGDNGKQNVSGYYSENGQFIGADKDTEQKMMDEQINNLFSNPFADDAASKYGFDNRK